MLNEYEYGKTNLSKVLQFTLKIKIKQTRNIKS